MAYPIYSDQELSHFREVQRLAYDATGAVARRLSAGTTEKEAARALDKELRARGVREYFHRPFAWFGDRTAFTGFRSPFDFFPTERRLEKGMPAILDVGPVVDGYAADIGYTFSIGDAGARDAFALLAELRALILAEVRAGKSMRAIYTTVDAAIARAGFENCHKRYPFHVLAHKVGRHRSMLLKNHTLLGFGRGGLELLGRAALAALPRPRNLTPFWNASRLADVRVEPGLWAVEPHVGRKGLGAKWEELLVVTDATAYWLDEDLPHARAFREAAGATSNGARVRAATV